MTVTVARKGLTITGLGAENKPYDGTTTAKVTGTAVVSGKVGNDNVSVSAGTAAFADKNAGNDKTVSFTGYSLSGADADNYLVSQPESVMADILPREVTLQWSDTSFPYDGKAHAPTATATGLVDGDKCEVTVTGAQTNAGSYTATAAKLSNSNYKLPGKVTQKFTVVQKEVGLKWSNTSFPYDGKSHLPTATATGLVKGDKCTVRVSGKQSKAGTYTATAAKLSNSNYKLPGNVIQKFTIIDTKKTDINNGLLLSEKGGVVTFSYGEVSDADSYVVYFRYCGTGSQKPLMTVKGAKNTSVKIQKFGGKKINRKRSYTAWVEAKKGKEVLETSVEVHASGSKRTDETNVESVSVKTSEATLKKNNTSAIAATVKKAGKGKLHKSSKIPQIRYFSSNKRVATVNGKGVIKAGRKGKCKIKVMAMNGVCTYVSVTVK